MNFSIFNFPKKKKLKENEKSFEFFKMEYLNSINYWTSMSWTCQGTMMWGCYAQKIYEEESMGDLKVLGTRLFLNK
jgi:hypothetical protein